METGNNSTTTSSSFGTKREHLPFLKKSWFSRFRMTFCNFFAFAFCSCPIHPFFSMFCSIFRLVQLYIPSMLLTVSSLYPQDTLIGSVSKVLSVFIRIIPVGSSIIGFRVLLFIYLFFVMKEFIFLFYNTQHFQKKTTIHPYSLQYICIYTLNLSNIIKPWAMSGITFCMFSKDQNIIDFVLSLLIYVSFVFTFFIDFTQNTVSLFFIPTSFVTLRQRPHFFLNLFIPLLCLLNELEAYLEIKYIIPPIMIVMYVVLYATVDYYGIPIQIWEARSFFATIITSLVTCIVSMTLSIVNMEVPAYCPLLYLAVWVISHLLYHIYHTRQIAKSIIILNSLEQDQTNFNQFKSTHPLLKHIINGFFMSHAYCVNFSIFRDALEHFPDDISLLTMFAKFLAIYPEEGHQLTWVLLRIKRNHRRLFFMKYLTTQINAILMKRDTSLSQELKHKMQSISQLIMTAKLRIRNAWESAMSGNTSRLLPLFEKATRLIEQINIRFSNLQSYHSNNHYALSLQAAYTKDILADYKEAERLREKIRFLQAGKASSIDQPFLFGRIFFPQLPSRLTLSPNQLLTNENQAHSSQEEFIFNAKDDDSTSEMSAETMNLHAQLKSSIDSISIPSIKCSIGFIILSVCIIFIIYFIAMAVLTPNLSSLISDPSKYLTILGEIRSMTILVYASNLRRQVEKANDLTSPCITNETLSDLVGGTCDTQEQMRYFSNKALCSLEKLPAMQLINAKNPFLKDAQMILFRTRFEFHDYSNWTHYSPVSRTLHEELINFVETGITIASDQNMMNEVKSNSYANIIMNYNKISEIMVIASNYLMEFLDSQVSEVKRQFTISQICVCIFVPVFNIIVVSILAKWILSNQQKIYHCFTALPKSTLQMMMQKLDNTSIQTTPQQNFSVTIEDIGENKSQDDKIIAVFHTAQHGSSNRSVVLFIVCLIIMTLFQALFLYFSTNLFITGSDSFKKSTPHLETIITSFIEILEGTVSLSLYASQLKPTHLSLVDLNKTFVNAFLLSQTKFHTFYFGNATLKTDPIVTTTTTVFSRLLKQPDFPDNMTTFHQLYQALPYDLMYYLAMEYIHMVYSTSFAISLPLNSSNEYLTNSWHMIIDHLYPGFFQPLFSSVSSDISELITRQLVMYYSVNAVLDAVGLVFAFIAVYLLVKTHRQLVSVLRLLLHAPPQVLLQSRYITALLSNDFNLKEMNLSMLDESAFIKVIADFPEGFSELDSTGRILRSNQLASKLLGNVEKLDVTEKKTVLVINGVCVEILITKYNSGYLATLHDMTVELKNQKMISEEEQKRETLLKMIIPEQVLKTYGEPTRDKFIAFKSNTVTAFALQIRAPTPKAVYSKVLDKLRELQNKYDSVEYVDLEFSKFIVVGGILESHLSAESVAAQVLHFAYEAIAYTKSLNVAKKNEIVAYSGFVSGGPISSGIINMNHIPQFELFGDVIDFAKIMCEYGAANAIHLTRSAYELIYSSEFDIREQGEQSLPLLGDIMTYTIQI